MSVRRALATMAALLVAVVAVSSAIATVVLHVRVMPVLSGSMTPTIRTGSIVVAVPVHWERIHRGDVIMYVPPSPYALGGRSVMHRVVELGVRSGVPTMRTRGDANAAMDPWTVDLRHGSFYRVVAHSLVAGQVRAAIHGLVTGRGLLLWPGVGAAALAAALARPARGRRRRDDRPTCTPSTALPDTVEVPQPRRPSYDVLPERRRVSR